LKVLASSKVAVIAYNETFLPPVLAELAQRHCTVKRTMFGSNETINRINVCELMQWADYAFFDFCNPPLVWGTRMARECRITARLHGLEVYEAWMHEIDWSKVQLVCSSPQFSRFQREDLPSPAQVHFLNIGVDIEPTKTPKQVFGHNIGLIAITGLPRKRIYTTIETFYDLLEQTKRGGYDANWQLHIRSTPSTWRIAESLEYFSMIKEFAATIQSLGLPTDPIIFHNYMKPDRYKEFLKGLDIIISNSMQEGYHQSIFEAMTYGVYPFVHRWLGADELFPEETLFLSQRELVDKILEWEQWRPESKMAKSMRIQNCARADNQNTIAKELVDIILGES
jgi:hypothetical protein